MKLGLLLFLLSFSPLSVGASGKGQLDLRSAQIFQFDSTTKQDEKSPFEFQADLRQNWEDWNFQGGWNFTEYQTSPWKRQDAQLRFEPQTSDWQLVLGDYQTTESGMRVPSLLGGIQIQKKMSVGTSRTAIRSGRTELRLLRPALVEIWGSGRLLYQTRRAAGRFNLRDLPLVAAQRKVVAWVKDDLGREEIFRFNFFFEGKFLKEGESELYLATGSPWRESGNDRAYDTTGSFSSLDWRRGWAPTWTLGAFYQNWFYRHLLGGEITNRRPWGDVTLEVLLTQVLGVTGSGLRWRWRSPQESETWAPEWAHMLEVEMKSSSFLPVTVEPVGTPSVASRTEIRSERSLEGSRLLALGLISQVPHGLGSHSNTFRVGGSQFFVKGWSLEIQLQTTKTGSQEEHRGLLNLNWVEEPSQRAAAVIADSRSHQAGLAMSRRREKGAWGAQAGVARAESQSEQLGFVESRLEGAWVARVASFQTEPSSPGASRQRVSHLGLNSTFEWGGEPDLPPPELESEAKTP